MSSVASLSPSALIGSLLLSKITPTRSSSSPTKYGGYPSSILEDVFESITTIGGSTTESQSSSSPGAAATSYEGTGDKDPDRKSTRLNSSHIQKSRMPSSA